MAKKFELSIQTPDGDIFRGEVESVKIMADGGSMKTLANHASITATLVFSPVTIEGENFTEEFIARQGVYFFNNQTNSATLLALYCEKKSEINENVAEEYLAFIEAQLAEGNDLSQFQLVYLEGEKLGVQQQLSSKE